MTIKQYFNSFLLKYQETNVFIYLSRVKLQQYLVFIWRGLIALLITSTCLLTGMLLIHGKLWHFVLKSLLGLVCLIFVLFLLNITKQEKQHCFTYHKVYYQLINMALKHVLIWLAMFCLILPGIYYHFAFSFSSYIINDAPNDKLTPLYGLHKSAQLMKGHVLELLAVECHFLIPALKSLWLFGLPLVNVYPHYELAKIEFYNYLLSQNK